MGHNDYIQHIRIDADLKAMMDKAIEELNQGGYLEVNSCTFIRQAIRFYAIECINKQVGFSFKEPGKNGKK
jgi:hypothetical protein